MVFKLLKKEILQKISLFCREVYMNIMYSGLSNYKSFMWLLSCLSAIKSLIKTSFVKESIVLVLFKTKPD